MLPKFDFYDMCFTIEFYLVSGVVFVIMANLGALECFIYGCYTYYVMSELLGWYVIFWVICVCGWFCIDFVCFLVLRGRGYGCFLYLCFV